MDINATLLGQMITFALFIIFTMKYVWPPIVTALEARQSKIADGLAAGERGHQELALAQQRATKQLKEAKEKSNQIIDQANKQGESIIEKAKQAANEERKRILESAESEVAQAHARLKEDLRKEVATIALVGAEKILGNTIDRAANEALLNKLIENI